MTAIIDTLKDENGNTVYPQTKTNAVFDDNNIDVGSLISNEVTARQNADTNLQNNKVNLTGYGYLSDMNYVERANKTYYYDNTTTNQPNGETWWGNVQYVYGGDANCVTQIVYRNDANYFYKRVYYYDGRGWQAWEKYSDGSMATEENLFSGNVTANTNLICNGSVLNYKFIIIIGCNQSWGGKAYCTIPKTTLLSLAKDNWSRLVVTDNGGSLGLYYNGETGSNSKFFIEGFTSSPSFNYLIIKGVR